MLILHSRQSLYKPQRPNHLAKLQHLFPHYLARLSLLLHLSPQDINRRTESLHRLQHSQRRVQSVHVQSCGSDGFLHHGVEEVARADC